MKSRLYSFVRCSKPCNSHESHGLTEGTFAKHARISVRRYATESAEYRHKYSGPPPPVPSTSLQAVASPSRSSSAVGSSFTSTSSYIATSSASSAKADTPSIPIAPKTSPSSLLQLDLPESFGENQRSNLITLRDSEILSDLEAILNEFRAPIRYAFAYGSGIFRQAGYTSKDKPMLDFVFAVSHPDHWHSINVNQHKSHYSMMSRILGSNITSILQEKVGGGVWFNVECLVRGRIIKYGVISVDTLCRDLLDWQTLYMAGRMHKPLQILRDDPRIRLANQVNLSSAVRASLLLLPERFSEDDLYTEIAGLSYRGDFRMRVGENPNKIKNIVTTQSEHFQKLYQPLVRSFHKHISFLGPEGSGSLRQDMNPRAKADMAKRLPLRLRGMIKGQYEREQNIFKALGKASEPEDAEADHKVLHSEETALWTKLVSQGNFKHNLDKSIQMIVAGSALSQSMKGIASVGPIRGIRYVWPKLKKKWLPRS